MKRSELNQAVRDATVAFKKSGWTLPPNPRWDVTDMGLGDFRRHGLVLVNLAEEEEYSEKLMYARRDQKTPAHTHKKKKEDIIARNGVLAVQLWNGLPDEAVGEVRVKVNGEARTVASGEIVKLTSGERVTLEPGIYHEFWPETDECVIGEVSTRNDDLHDNFFADPDIGRFPEIDEDEEPIVRLISDK